MLTTVLIALPIFFALRTLRKGPGDVRRAWAHAHAWERACMLLAFVPIPGPADDIIAALVLARVLRRIEAEQ